ncbi:FHA domain-containing protein [Selenihalanaerobacter shriftii]|uniref:FHA domain-containing protein n=1 Tax=Selenihalanaerobacter shriftii TaxID=142842 RepID=A0A1T4Q261_9FIRM|nr:FHA domain-containing protein [Selenihalanaerobacter shriftii]SJZ97627.1 FHA domain-containing protein [Selenihalanaerobacter shriftii]
MKKFNHILRRILSIINIPQHIKRYYLKRKISKYKNNEYDINNAKDKNDAIITNSNKNSLLLKIINFLVVMGVSALIVYFNLVYQDRRLLIVSIAIPIIIGIVFLVKRYRRGRIERRVNHEIRSLILKDSDDKIIHEWDINELRSVLIGKKTKVNEVDVDLSQATYSSLISREHAVMNNTGDKWYFEDIGSSNGSGIKRKNTDKKFKINEGKPYPINSGDTIYIANTKLLVK